MSSQVQFRRGTTTQNNAFTGGQGEITYDTDIKTLRLHDGSTAGGGATVVTLSAAQSLTNKTMSTGSIWSGNAIGLTYGGTGSSLTAAAGAIAYSTSGGLALNSPGTSGQLLQSAGSGTPIWVNASSLTTGTATNATNAANIQGGSAGYLVYQTDTNTTGFIAPGTSGYVLRSTGASTAPAWVTSALTIGTTALQVGDTSTSFAGLTSLTMGNGSYGNATVGTITGTGPWTATLTGITTTTGIMVGQNINATAGTGTLYGGTPTSVLVASIVSGTSITVTVTGGIIPTAGTITSLTTFGFLQVPTGTTAQRPWVPVAGMVRYNSTQSTFEGYSSGAWSSLGGVKSVDALTYIIAETSAGASNGELEFYAEDASGTATVKIGGWNYYRFLEATGTVLGTQTTQNLFNTVATTVNAFGAATAITLGNATSATLTLRPGTVVGSNTTQTLYNTVATTVNAFGAATAITLGNTTSATLTLNPGTIVGANTTQNLFNTVATTLNIGGAATTLALGASTGTATIANPTVTLTNATALNINGVSPVIASTSTGTLTLFNTALTTVNAFGAATTLNIGNSSGSTTLSGNLTVTGNITIQGSTETVSSANTTYSDSLLELHYANGGTLTSDDGKDIGLRMHYYKGSDKNAALVLSNDESQMEFYVNGTETSGVFSGTYGYYKAQGFNHADIFLHDSFTATTSGTSAYTVYSFPIATYRSADITVQVKNGTTYSIQKMLVIHDGTTASISANYLTDSQLQTASTGTTFSATISAGNLLVQATVPSGSSVVKGSARLFTI